MREDVIILSLNIDLKSLLKEFFYSDPSLLFVHFISLIFKSYEALIKDQKWFLAGLWEAIRKRKEILKKRKIERKFWKYSDRKILRVIDEEIK